MGKGHLCTPLWRSFTYQKDPWISQGLRRVISSSGPRVPSDLNVQKKHLWSSSIYLLKASKKPIVVGVINNWANQLTELNMILRYCKAPKDGIPTDPNRTKYRFFSFFFRATPNSFIRNTLFSCRFLRETEHETIPSPLLCTWICFRAPTKTISTVSRHRIPISFVDFPLGK